MTSHSVLTKITPVKVATKYQSELKICGGFIYPLAGAALLKCS